MEMNRRLFIDSLWVSFSLGTFVSWGQTGESPKTFQEKLAAMEKLNGGRLGVAALNTATGRRLEYRATERFAMCSTFKWILVAAILDRVDQGKESLACRVPYGKEDLLSYAPVTRQHLREGAMTVEALCAAAIIHSDNTAANLLLQILGGPEALTAYVRSLGDTVTRLDRNEPTLNSNLPGDVRDTTSPKAMLETMHKVFLGQALTPASRRRLEGYLLANATGGKRLRAGIPALWSVGDKTGSGMNGACNDVAIVWPTGRPPILIAAYSSESSAETPVLEKVLAQIGTLVTQELVAREEFPLR